MIVSLTREEREKFAAWLEQDAAATLMLVEQMEKIGVHEMVKKAKRTEALAQQVVARMLRSTQEMSIGGGA